MNPSKSCPHCGADWTLFNAGEDHGFAGDYEPPCFCDLSPSGEGYTAPTCATCNHKLGDHKSSGHASLTVHHGRCLIPGCACTAFTPRSRSPVSSLLGSVSMAEANPAQSAGRSDGRWWLRGPVDEHLIPKTLGMNSIADVLDTLIRIARTLGYECETVADFDVIGVVADEADSVVSERDEIRKVLSELDKELRDIDLDTPAGWVLVAHVKSTIGDLVHG